VAEGTGSMGGTRRHGQQRRIEAGEDETADAVGPGTTTTPPPAQPRHGHPGALLASSEPARAFLDASALAASLPVLRLAPLGDPHPVLVLPGLLASDLSTVTLRVWLRRLGHPVVGWALGCNLGPTREVVDALPPLVARLAARHAAPISIIGWSLGGIFARRLALQNPEHIRQVISLGSPFAGTHGGRDTSPGARTYQRFAHLHSTTTIHPSTEADDGPLPVPSTSVYSRWDGIVDWRSCLQQVGPTSENIEVLASHLGMGHNPAVLWAVADRLAQPRDEWRPFQRPTGLGLGALFPERAPG
jgi:pimeloyl-ACP methyl ester carboxylesterase